MNTRILTSSLTLIVSAFFASSLHATDLFFGFSNSTGSNQALSSVGWSAYSGNTATDITTGTIAAFISSSAGNPNSSTGFLAIVPQVANSSYAAVTTFSSFNANGSTITWALGNTVAGAITVQLLVQSGGNWYVSDATFTNSGYSTTSFGSATSDAVTQSLNLSTATWKLFTLTSGSSMSIGLTAVLDATAITGIGFYVTNTTVGGGSAVRLDSLSIPATAIPEPSIFTAALGGIVFLGCLAARRRGR